jgi:hypothetical protein
MAFLYGYGELELSNTAICASSVKLTHTRELLSFDKFDHVAQVYKPASLNIIKKLEWTLDITLVEYNYSFLNSLVNSNTTPFNLRPDKNFTFNGVAYLADDTTRAISITSMQLIYLSNYEPGGELTATFRITGSNSISITNNNAGSSNFIVQVDGSYILTTNGDRLLWI